MPFDMGAFRKLLRAAREARVGGRDKLATKIQIAKSTIQSAEMGPDIPGIDTVAKMIEAMPGLTLSSFFAQIEGLPGTPPPRDDQPSPAERAVIDDPPTEEEYRSALRTIQILSEIVGREAERGTAAYPRRVTGAPVDAPVTIKHRARSRGRTQKARGSQKRS